MTLRFYDACPFGLCSEISPQGIRWRRHQPAAHDLRQGLRRLRGATDRDGRRGRSRSPACGIPAQGGCLQSREQPQRRLQSPAAEGTARHPEALLERRAVVAVLFRFKLRRRADFHRAPVHRAAANSTLKPKDKDGCAVRAILPRPERRGLSRTASNTAPIPGLTRLPTTVLVALSVLVVRHPMTRRSLRLFRMDRLMAHLMATR